MTRQKYFPDGDRFAVTAAAMVFGAALLCGHARADDTPVPSKHQLMKECMAKQKASESGKSHADMRKACKDVTQNEKQNDDRAAGDSQPSQK